MLKVALALTSRASCDTANFSGVGHFPGKTTLRSPVPPRFGSANMISKPASAGRPCFSKSGRSTARYRPATGAPSTATATGTFRSPATAHPSQFLTVARESKVPLKSESVRASSSESSRKPKAIGAPSGSITSRRSAGDSKLKAALGMIKHRLEYRRLAESGHTPTSKTIKEHADIDRCFGLEVRPPSRRSSISLRASPSTNN